MRLFVAIDVPEKIDSYLKEIQNTIKDIRPVKTFHLTLKFLGDVSDHARIENALASVRFKNLSLETTVIGAFPSKENIRVLWVGLKPNPYLTALQKDIELALPGFHDDFEFHPHITIARTDKQIPFPKSDLFSYSFVADTFCLYESVLTREGPIYNKIREFRSS